MQPQRSTPAPTAPGPVQIGVMPDLAIESYDGQRNTIVIVNRGTADAVFPVSAPLVSYGDTQVPAGGKITKGQRVEVRIGAPWACPDSIYSDWQYLNFNAPGRQWNYTLPQPVDREGKKLILVDPNGIVAESNRNNNAFLVRRANPFKPVESQALPNLRVISIVLREEDFQGKRLLRWNFKVQNFGPGIAFICDNACFHSQSEVHIGGKVANVKIDGNLMGQNTTFVKAPWVFRPGESKEIWHFTELSIPTQFGTMSPGLQAGCHEINVIADPQGLIPEAEECDNMTTTYYATGGATCPPDKVGILKVSTCRDYPVKIGPAMKLAPAPTSSTQAKALEPAPVIKRVEPSPPTFESTMKKALDLYASFISRAAPQVRAKISASALAFKDYLAQCSRNCDLYQFCFRDLTARFTSLTDTQLHLLMTLVFAEVSSNMSQQAQHELQMTMQRENQIFTAISNVLKTQHDMLKSSISNIR